MINLEWIQKIHRDRASRGYTTEAVTDTILRRMHAYVHVICPQFTQTDINFQRVPVVDTSNPFVARWIPMPAIPSSSFASAIPRASIFPYLVSMIHNSWMSRANSIVIPGDKMDIAMQLILTPMILRFGTAAVAPDNRPALQIFTEGSQHERDAAGEEPGLSKRAFPDMANAIRALAMDAVEKANSGHPGMPMGMADVATVLFTQFIKFDPDRSALARPRPLRALGRPRLDAAICAASISSAMTT